MNCRELLQREPAPGDPSLISDDNEPVTRRREQSKSANGPRQQFKLLWGRDVFSLWHFPIQYAIAVQESGAKTRIGGDHCLQFYPRERTAPAKRATIDITMALIRIAALDELPEGRLLQRDAGATTLAVCNQAGTIHAFLGLCPHHNGPLGQGSLVDGCIVCPWHAWEFSVEKGELDYNPGIKLRRYAVVVQGLDVFVDIP